MSDVVLPTGNTGPSPTPPPSSVLRDRAVIAALTSPPIHVELNRHRNALNGVAALVMSTDGDWLDGSDFDGLVGEIQAVLREFGFIDEIEASR